MARQSFTVNNGADLPAVFTLTGMDRKGASYLNAATSLAEPQKCDISLDLRPAGGKGSDRVTQAFSTTIIDPQGLPQTARISVMVTRPRSPVVTDAVMADLRAFAVNDLTLSNFEKLCDGIVT